MSTTPCHDPTSDFIRSNSGEAGFAFPGWGGGGEPEEESAPNATEAAKRAVAQTAVNDVFIILFVISVFNCFAALHHYNERAGRVRTLACIFLKEWSRISLGRPLVRTVA
jgi:hypothetical protein